MQITLKKLAYLLLSLALFSLSAQMLFAATLQSIEANESIVKIKQNAADHCLQKPLQTFLLCEQCTCDIHITTLANLLSATKIFLHRETFTDKTIEISAPYTQLFHRPLLRPPII